MVVQADPSDVAGFLDAEELRHSAAAADTAHLLVTEVVVEELALDRPGAAGGDFNSTARGPSGFEASVRRIHRAADVVVDGGAQVSPDPAASAVDQDRVERHTETRARGRVKTAIGVDNRVRGYWRRFASARPKITDIGFDTEDPVAGLPVVANLAAAHETLWLARPLKAAAVPARSVGRHLVGRGGVAPGIARMRADVVTAPIVDGWRCLVDRRFGREIRRHRRATDEHKSHNRGRSHKQRFH